MGDIQVGNLVKLQPQYSTDTDSPNHSVDHWELNFSQVELEVPIFTQRLSLMLLLFMGGPVAPMRRLFPDSHIEISPLVTRLVVL